VRVKTLINNQWRQIELHGGEYNGGRENLFAENILLKKGFTVKESSEGVTYYRNGKPDIQAEIRDGLQIMCFRPIVNRALTCVIQVTWHKRVGHINCDYLKKAAEQKAAFCLEKMQSQRFHCETCALAKLGRNSKICVGRSLGRITLL